MIGDYLVYVLMSINFGAAIAYFAQGVPYKGLYWLAAFTLNFCILQMKG
jgi:hypothetical protein